MDVNGSSNSTPYNKAAQSSSIQPLKSPEAPPKSQEVVPNEPSKEVRPVAKSSESSLGRNVDVIV